MKQAGFSLILVVILLALALMGGYLVYQNQTKTTKAPQQITQPSPTQSDITHESTTPGETANWKTYTNTKYKFSFKYPPNFYTNQSTPGPNKLYSTPLYVEVIDNQYDYGSMNYPEVVIEVIQTRLSPEEWVNQNGTTISVIGQGPRLDKEYFYYGIEIKGSRSIDSYSGFQFKSQAVSSTNLHTLIEYTDDLLIDIRSHSSGVGEFPEDIYNQILSTFRFLP